VTSFYDDLTGFGSFGPAHGNNPFALGPEVTLSDSGVLSPHSAAGGAVHSGGSSFWWHPSAPSPTLVSATGSNLAIDLVWDSSVSNAPSGFMSAVTASAKALVTDLTAASKTVLYIAVGWGEIAGQAMASNALGESESNGYLTSYATVANALTSHGAQLNATNEPTSAQFFLTSAQAKELGLVGGTSGGTSSVDGYIGFSSLAGTGYSWQYAATGTTATQFNMQSVVDHEISEVMGRISMEGTVSYYGKPTYTPLDLFDFSSYSSTTGGTLALSNTGGYFSNNNGATNLGNFNPASLYGGDIGDWASWNSTSDSGTVTSGQDAFNAFGRPGYDLNMSKADLLEMQALGFGLTAAGKALTA
jgi:hypothetical protein